MINVLELFCKKRTSSNYPEKCFSLFCGNGYLDFQLIDDICTVYQTGLREDKIFHTFSDSFKLELFIKIMIDY